jgi:hypothetical protein
MRNLTVEIQEAMKCQSNWTKEKQILFIKRWEKEDNSLWFDCDVEAGEQWVRVFKDNCMFGLLGVDFPILFLDTLSEDGNRNYNFFEDVHVVKERDFDADIWKIDLEILKKALPGIVWNASQDAVNPERMSINDFWYATV